nr:MAG TPA: hypothetical protein [Caudoviricetes sp.]
MKQNNTRFLYLKPGEVEVYPRLRLFNFIKYENN